LLLVVGGEHVLPVDGLGVDSFVGAVSEVVRDDFIRQLVKIGCKLKSTRRISHLVNFFVFVILQKLDLVDAATLFDLRSDVLESFGSSHSQDVLKTI
jgi:hypothetical protein